MFQSRLLWMLIPALISPVALAADGAPDGARDGAPRFLAGVGLALEYSNLEDWAQADGGGTDYDYVSGGIGADLYAGVEVMRWLSLRLGHHEFGEQEADAYGGGFYLGELTIDGEGNYFAVDALYPLNDQVLAGITLGSLTWDGEARFQSVSGAVSRSDESGRDPFWGLRGRILINDGKAAVTAFVNGYSLDTDNTTKELKYQSIGVGVELRL